MLEENSYSPWEGCKETPHPLSAFSWQSSLKQVAFRCPFQTWKSRPFKDTHKKKPLKKVI